MAIMYLRYNRRIKDGKEHRYWNIVESKRCAGGRVVQRQVLPSAMIRRWKESSCNRINGRRETAMGLK
jgi:hypothetical protein